MKNLTFDENGYLQPYKPIEADLNIFKKYFVDAFPNSERRRLLFDNYLRFLYRFKDEVFPLFEQWINGSFVTQKENPKDIDIVTFLDYKIWERRGAEVLDKFWTFSLEDKFIDSYLVASYPSDHPNYSVFKSEQELWADRYETDKDNYPKGFIKLVFKKT
jgi:Family of unknown function (DUF6932)